MKPTEDAGLKEKEFNWLRAFQEKCLTCPRSIPDQPNPPAPDLLFKECILGIEVTEYLLGQGKAGSQSRRLENVRRRIVSGAQSEYESHTHYCLQVSVLWATDDCPAKREEKVVAQAIARIVASRTSENQRLVRVGWEQFADPIVERYVAEVSIYLIGERGRSCWSSGATIWSWEAEPRIQAALDQKESKLRQYRKICDEIWLLMVADGSWLSSRFFPNETFEQAVFNSSFDRAFLLDTTKSDVHEIRLMEPNS